MIERDLWLLQDYDSGLRFRFPQVEFAVGSHNLRTHCAFVGACDGLKPGGLELDPVGCPFLSGPMQLIFWLFWEASGIPHPALFGRPVQLRWPNWAAFYFLCQ